MLKATFDQAGVDIKEALNALIAELEASSSASNIGANVSSVTTKTVQAILTNFEGAIANRYTKNEIDTLVSGNTNNLVADIDVNLTTGVITVTKKDGTVETFDTALEKVPAKFEIVESGTSLFLKITNVDGTSTQTNITDLMNIYDFSNTNDIAFNVSGTGNEKVVTASIRPNSIGLDKLSLSVMTTLEGYMASARDSASAAKTSEISARDSANTATRAAEKASIAEGLANTAIKKATEAESYAHGGTGTREGEDTDNAKYYSQVAKEVAGGDFVTPTEMEAYAQKKGTAPTYESTELSGEVIETELPLAMESILKISGNSEQETSDVMPSPDYPSEIRSVKSKSDNILSQELFTTVTTVNGVTFTPNADGSIKISGTATARTNLHFTKKLLEKLTVGKTYTSSIGQEMSSSLRMIVEETKGSSWVANISYVGKTTWTYNGLTSGDAYGVFLAIDSGSVLDTTIYPMINEGDKALPYQPYGYVPVEAKVEGKNLLKKTNSYVTTTTNGITYTVNKDQSVTINGTNNGTAHSNLYLWDEDSEPVVIPAGTYKVGRTGHNGVQILYYDGSKFGVLASNSKDTITFASDTTLTRVYITIEKTVTTTFNNVTVYPIMVRNEHSLEPYEPYQTKTLSLPLGDIELRSTPDGTRDTFERVDGVWNYRGDITPFTITEDMVEGVNLTYHPNSPLAHVSLSSVGASKINYKSKICLMTNYKEQKPTGTEGEHGRFVTSASQNRLQILNKNITSLETAKTILAGETGIIKLDTPTYTPITDTALIQALDTLEQLILHKGYNRITVTSVNGVKAYLDLSIPSTASVTEVVETESSLDMPVVVVAGEGDVKPKVANQLTVNPSTGEAKINGEKVATETYVNNLFQASETDLEAGVSPLETGKIYFVFE